MNQAKEWIRHGYKVVPVDSSGAPVFKGIYEERYSEKDVSAWEATWPGANLAVVCGANEVVALDVDVDDDYVANCLRRKIPSLIGTVLMRRREGTSRFAMLCREGEGMERIAGAHSNIYIVSAFGDAKQQIEYKGDRRVLTVDGFHRRDNKSRYQVKNIPHVSELGILTRDAFEKVMGLIDFYKRDGWRCIGEFREVYKRNYVKRKEWSAVDNVFPPEDGMANATIQRRPFTEQEIEDLLEEVDGSIRENWMNVGICMWNLNNGAKPDYDRWNEWCKGFSGYGGERDQRYHWSTFKNYPRMTFEVMERRIRNSKKRKEGVTIKEEELDNFRPKKLSENEEYANMINKYVLIADGALVADMSKPPSESIRSIPQMREFLRSKKIMIQQKTGKGTLVEKPMPMFDYWLQDKDHIEAWGIDYVPGMGPLIPSSFFKGRPQQYYNKYSPPLVVKIEKEERLYTGLELFYNHMKYLFPNGGDRWMLNWMAQLLQEPEKRIGRVSPFSISTHEGTGRGWLSELLVRLVGNSNYATVKDIGDIIRPSAKSGYLDGTVLLVVNEVYVKGRERYNLLSQLKTLLTDDVQEIDVKYGKHTYNQQIYTRVFFQSNHIDGLVIDERDSRIQPFINTAAPKDREYYARLYALLDSDLFVDSVYSELMEYPIDYSLLQYSQDTPDRQRVIRSTKSPTALAFYEFHQTIGDNLFTDEILDQFMLDYLQKVGVNGEPTMVNQKALRFLRSDVDQNAVIINRTTYKSFGVVDIDSEEEGKEALRITQKLLKDFFKSKGIKGDGQ